MVLIHNKANNREREEKCSPESHKYRISSGGKLLSTRMRQKWTRVNLEVPGAAASWRDVTEKGSGSPTAYFVCAGDFLFPPLPHFWTTLIPSGVRTTLPLSLLLWAPSQEALHYCRSTRAFWAQLEMNTAERRTKNDRAFLADEGYKKRPRCGETSLTKGVCQEHGETGLQCGNDTARFRKRKLKLSKHTATWWCWEKWKSLHFVWFPSSTGRGLPGKGPSPHWQGAELKRGQWHLLLASWAAAHHVPHSRTGLPGSLFDLIWSYLHFQVPLQPKALLLPWGCPQQTWIHLQFIPYFPNLM